MKVTLKKRDIVGKKVKSLRNEQLIPANIYGPERESTNVMVNEKEILSTFANTGYNKLFDVELEGEGGTHKALIKEVQSDPIKGDVFHVSIYQVDMKKPITTAIPVYIEGESPAVKKNIGILVTPVNSITVRCLPGDLPEKIVLNVDGLENIGDMKRVSDVALPEGVEFTHDVNTKMSLVYIAPPQKKIIEESSVAVEGGEVKEGEADAKEAGSAESGE